MPFFVTFNLVTRSEIVAWEPDFLLLVEGNRLTNDAGEGEQMKRKYSWVECEWCWGNGEVEAPDNGTNLGLETCDECGGEGGHWEDEFGNSPYDNGEES